MLKNNDKSGIDNPVINYRIAVRFEILYVRPPFSVKGLIKNRKRRPLSCVSRRTIGVDFYDNYLIFQYKIDKGGGEKGLPLLLQINHCPDVYRAL